MKSLLVVLSLIGSVAFAEMKPVGTFVPYQCGFSPSGQICLGKKVGMNGSFLSVAVQRSAARVYKIVKTTPINGGINPKASAVVLDLVSDTNTAKKARATLRSMNGKVTSASVNLGNGVVVSVGALEIAVTTL